MNEDKLLVLINEWLYHNEKLREITQYLYNRTELFEKQYEKDYQHELFDYFSGKITKYAKDRNILFKLLDEKQIKKLKFIEMTERRF